MCRGYRFRHPSCGHAAHGTTRQRVILQRCEGAIENGILCQNMQWTFFEVARGYCDRCIIHGELLSQERGLGPGVYCSQFGVGYTELLEANPWMFS